MHDGYHDNSARYPLGLAYLTAHLQNAGHRVELIDFRFIVHTPAEMLARLKAIRADMIGLGGMVSSYVTLKEISHAIKQYHPNTPIILGGAISFKIESLIMQHNPIDALCVGEGEYVIVEIANALAANRSLATIPGLWIRDENGQGIPTAPRDQIKDLDAILFPAWDTIKPSTYLHSTYDMSQERPMLMIASRGCPASCDYCCRVIQERTIRYRSVESVFDEISVLYGNYGVTNLTFVDEYLTADLRWVRALCEKIIAAKLPIRWNASSRVRLFDDETYDLFQEAGCNCLSFGVESASPEVLKSYSKRQRPGDTLKIYQKLCDRQIKMNFLLMVGAVVETEATLKETVHILLPHGTAARFYYLTPFPGTPIYEQARITGHILDEDEYLTKVATTDNSMEQFPTINLTQHPLERLIEIKESAQKDTFKMHLLRNVVGLFGEHYLRLLLCFKSARDLRMALPHLQQTWITYLDTIQHLQKKYPEQVIDVYYYLKTREKELQMVLEQQNPQIQEIPQPVLQPENQELILNYLLHRYGVFAEKALEQLIQLPVSILDLPQAEAGFKTLQALLKRDLLLWERLRANLKGEYLTLCQKPTLSRTDTQAFLPDPPLVQQLLGALERIKVLA